MAEESNIILSYNDCLLRKSDVDLLKGPHWLNDVIIGFYFEYLGNKYNATHPKKLLFISPELTQLLKLSQPSDYALFLDPLEASNSSFVFFPLNNCKSRENAGGSHWSLLVYSKSEATFFHFDSSQGYNASSAYEFVQNVKNYFKTRATGEFTNAKCPQQNNSYDCGLFVLCFTDVLANYASSNDEIENCTLDNVSNLVRNKRTELLMLIKELSLTN